MTEAEWLACDDPIDLLLQPSGSLAGDRKVRLFACACCRRIWADLGSAHREAVEAAERHADGIARPGELAEWEARLRLYRDVDEPEAIPEDQPPNYWCGLAAWQATIRHARGGAIEVAAAVRPVARDRSGEWEEVVQARMLRCVLGNPFRPVAFDPRWRTADVRALASSIYDDRAFDRLPVLADALLDAGCEDEDITGHCRSAGPHVRGCWVVDLILGKT